ncbi:hypothetical protein [Aeromicrobium sp. 50.2.37]|uniref:hypothetical protein n=1 Tax=Aeromicrobium sp. 50.2.37 TaxID=2969305 RepID=UPI00214FFE7D|nr:hypothetical protein [Aeromicrobium sp. 50.2.37]MCR4512108.1 hypothetical protein [Aeromicrobium sp. 50.2.37]
MTTGEVRAGTRRAATVLAGLVATALLTGCGVDDDDVAALEELAGVERASSSCELGRCSVRVEVRPTIRAAQLTAVFGEARDTGATTVEVVEGETDDAASSDLRDSDPRVSVELDEDSERSADGATARLAVASFDLGGVSSWRLSRREGRSSLAASVQGAPALRWPKGRALWDGVSTLPGPDMVLTSRSVDSAGPSRLVASGEYPERAVAFTVAVAEEFGASRLTGVSIGSGSGSGPEDEGEDGTGVLLAVRSASDATALESLLDDVPGGDGLAVSVVVADNVLAARPDPTQDPDGRGAGTEADRRALLSSLEDEPAVSASVQANVLRVRAVGTLAEVRAALERARQAHPDAYARVPVTVEPDTVLPGSGTGDPQEQEIDLSTVGSLDLLDLVADLGEVDGAGAVGVQAHGETYDYLKPPSDTDAFVSVRAQRPGIDELDAVVQDVARVLSRWKGPETSLSMSIGVEDPEGRQASVVLRIDRRAGTWVASSSERGTEDTIASGIRAWTSAS